MRRPAKALRGCSPSEVRILSSPPAVVNVATKKVKLPLVRSTLLDRPSSDAAFLGITRKPQRKQKRLASGPQRAVRQAANMVGVAKLVDAPGCGPGSMRTAGSSPVAYPIWEDSL